MGMGLGLSRGLYPSQQMRCDFSDGLAREMRSDFSNGTSRQKRNEISYEPGLADKREMSSPTSRAKKRKNKGESLIILHISPDQKIKNKVFKPVEKKKYQCTGHRRKQISMCQ